MLELIKYPLENLARINVKVFAPLLKITCFYIHKSILSSISTVLSPMYFLLNIKMLYSMILLNSCSWFSLYCSYTYKHSEMFLCKKKITIPWILSIWCSDFSPSLFMQKTFSEFAFKGICLPEAQEMGTQADILVVESFYRRGEHGSNIGQAWGESGCKFCQ